MVRIKTNGDLCCEVNLNAASYNLIKLSCSQMNTDFNAAITSIDLTSYVKKGDMVQTVIDRHVNDENAHKNLFNEKADISILSDVAISGSYDDLTDKPTIPVVNNATITITQGGVEKGSFSVNQSSNSTVEIDDNSSVWGNITGSLSNQTDLQNILNAKTLVTFRDWSVV